MRINKLLKISAMMAFVMLTNQSLFAKTTSQEAYDNYSKSYQNYQNAIAENKSQAEIKEALEAYKAAKTEYLLTVGSNQNTGKYETNFSAPVNNTIVNGTTAIQTNSVGIATVIPVNPVISRKSDIQRGLDDLEGKLDADMKALIDELRETQDKRRALEIITLLENSQVRLKDKSLINLVKYDIATALDRLKLDDKKCEALLNELENSKDPKFVELAKLNKDWRAAKTKKANWQNELARQNDELNNTKASFKNASWLAFPVKIYRGVKSVVANTKFTNNEGDYEDYMVQYEAIQANFITNVESVFNEWQAGIQDPEECADIRLVYDNYAAWYSRWNLLNNARSTIDVQYFIIENDAFGYSLLGTLLKKADDGVKVRLMVDTRGSKDISILTRGYLLELADHNNVEVRVYNPITSNVLNIFTDIRKVESSDHDKIMIVDGEKCITGGRNIANTYLVNEIDMDDAWRDCDIVIDSEKICSQLKQAFDEEFNSMKAYDAENHQLGYLTNRYIGKMNAAYACMQSYLEGDGLLKITDSNKSWTAMINKMNKELKQYVHMDGYNQFNIMDGCHTCPAHVLDNNSLTGDRKDITENIVKYIDGSRTEIIIQNPYFALTDRAHAALVRASKRGIPIYVHSNSERSSDSAPTEAYVLREWKNMLTEMPTMRFFARNSDGQLHGKTFNFDGKVAVVGSYNFDSLSEKVNSEIAVAIKSKDFCSELRGDQMNDIEEAVEYRMATDTQEEFAPDDVEKAKNKLLTKVLSYFKCFDNFF